MNIPTTKISLPGYLKYFAVLASIVLTCYVLIIGQPIFNPLLAAFIIALLLKPLASFIERIKIPRIISTIFSLLFVLVLIIGLSTFFSMQIGSITSDMDSLANSFNVLFDQLQQWTATHFGITPHEQIIFLKSSLTTLLKSSTDFYKNTLSATAGFLATFFLFVIALFFFLYYRTFLVTFLYRSVNSKDHKRMKKVLDKIQNVVRQYTIGLVLVILIVATLNTIGLWALGIQHAIFFGIFAAVLLIIPYIGITIGSLFPMIYALATTDSLWYPAGVLMLFVGVQFLEGNFITPNVVGTQVSINPFAAILGLFVAGMLFGIMGVIFIIPVLAIIKVISDEVSSLKLLGYLLGNPSKRATNALVNSSDVIKSRKLPKEKHQ